MEDDAKVILCSAEPTWAYHEIQGPDAYKAMQFLESTILGDTAREIISLAGDIHSYARYAHADGRQRFIAGGGGAYLAASHNLPEKLELPGTHGTETFKEASVYPTRAKSRALASGAVVFFLWNRWFAPMVGALYLLFVASVQSTSVLWVGETNSIGYKIHALDLWPAAKEFLHTSILSATTVLLLAVLLFGLGVYAEFKNAFAKIAVGTLHTGAHVAAIILLTWWFAKLNTHFGGSFLWHMAVFSVEMLIAGALAGSMIFGLYYLIMSLIGRHLEHAFSTQGLTLYKQFLRFRITADRIDFYNIGVDKMPDWKLRKAPAPPYSNGQQASWFEGRIKARMVDRGSVGK